MNRLIKEWDPTSKFKASLAWYNGFLRRFDRSQPQTCHEMHDDLKQQGHNSTTANNLFDQFENLQDKNQNQVENSNNVFNFTVAEEQFCELNDSIPINNDDGIFIL